jgi:uncharacterized tellurite resistance protein B-like protein
MLKRLVDFLSGESAPATETKAADEIHLAVAALLIEAARMDSTFSDDERAMIERLLAEKFKLSGAEVATVFDEAQRKVAYSAQYYPFTSVICRNMTIEQRTDIIEMLWRVAYADGVLDPHEDMLLRQVAGLIHVPDRERGLARQRAIAAAQG